MRSPLRPPVLVALLFALSTTACSTQVALAPRLEAPASLLTCAPQPAPGDWKTDTDLTDWIISLADAGEDCRSKLGNVATIIQGQTK